MGTRKTAEAFALILTLLCAGSVFSGPRADPKDGAAALPEKEKAPIVRMDILLRDQGELGPPLRDIFKPRTARETADRPAPWTPAVKTAPAPAQVAGFALEITYIGSVGVSGRTMALVLRRGQTVSVAEGDEVLPGYRVVRITPDEIVVEGPNSERRTFTR